MDSRVKRSSAVGVNLPFGLGAMWADGSIAVDDRAVGGLNYAGYTYALLKLDVTLTDRAPYTVTLTDATRG